MNSYQSRILPPRDLYVRVARAENRPWVRPRLVALRAIGAQRHWPCAIARADRLAEAEPAAGDHRLCLSAANALGIAIVPMSGLRAGMLPGADLLSFSRHRAGEPVFTNLVHRSPDAVAAWLRHPGRRFHDVWGHP